MEIRKNGTVELNDRDIDKIRLDRIAEVEKQRDYLLPSCSEIPKDEFGLFNKEDFNKWVNADSDRQKELWDSVYEPHMDGLDDEVYEKGLSTKTPEFRREMILDWFLGYLKKRITDDESLEDSTKEAMKKIIDDKGASLGIDFKNKENDLKKLYSAITPIEEYANNKAIASYNGIYYEPSRRIKDLLLALEQRNANAIVKSELGKKIVKKHWHIVFDELIQTKMNKTLGKKSKKGNNNTETRLRNMFQYLGKDYLEDITITDCKKLSNNIKKFPNVHKKGECISPQTANYYLTEFNELFTYARKTNPHLLNVKDHIDIPSKRVIKKQSTPRVPFREEHLEKIFGVPSFWKMRYSIRYFPKFWVPLIGLYSGCRLNEICQLEYRNIKQIDGVYCFQITDAGFCQSLKNLNSERIVPIHSQLIKLGFLDFVKKLQEAKDLRKNWVAYDSIKFEKRNKRLPVYNPNGIFFSLNYLEDNRWGHIVSSWFSSLLKKKGLNAVKDDNEDSICSLCLHCLRHNAASSLSNGNVSGINISSVLGWKKQNVGPETYFHISQDVSKNIVESISYPEFEKNVLPHLMPDPEKEKDFFNFK